MRHKNERGSALIEVALTLPLLLLVAVGIFEFGRAYQTWQVLTNAAREGARVAVLPNQPSGAAQTRVPTYLTSGQLPNAGTATVTVTPTTISIGGTTTPGSRVSGELPVLVHGAAAGRQARGRQLQPRLGAHDVGIRRNAQRAIASRVPG